MKDHNKFYNFLIFMAVVNFVVGGYILIASTYRLIRWGDWEFLYIAYALPGIAIGVCDFMRKLKAVGILFIVKGMLIIWYIFAVARSLSTLYIFRDPFFWIIFAFPIGYCVCGMYALHCYIEEKNFNKAVTAQ